MTDSETSSSLSTTLTNLQNELSTLNRVSHRLAMTDAGPPLEKVLHLLLPRLLMRIGKNDDSKRGNKLSMTNKRKSPEAANTVDEANDATLRSQMDGVHTTIHNKLIEMLAHTMKRVREDRACKLPCGAIADLLSPQVTEETQTAPTTASSNSSTPPSTSNIATKVNAFTINLSLAFLTLGINRCTQVECAAVLSPLLQFLEHLLTDKSAKPGCVGVHHLIDPSQKMRYNQTWHLILRCLECISDNPVENAAVKRAAMSKSSKSSSSVSNASSSDIKDQTTTEGLSLQPIKQLILSNPIISAALYDLFTDVFLFSPMPATSTLIPNGLSTAGYQRLIGGAASQHPSSGGKPCKNWKEEFATRASLRVLKLKLLDLITPCRRFALFLQDGEKKSLKIPVKVADRNDGISADDAESAKNAKSTDSSVGAENSVGAEGSVGAGEVGDAVVTGDATSLKSPLNAAMGISRTVALMTLLTGDSDPDVKKKAESYLRAHMDAYRGKDVSNAGGGVSTSSTSSVSIAKKESSNVNDLLLGNSVALVQSILSLVVGDTASISIRKKLLSQYRTDFAQQTIQLQLGLTYNIGSNDTSGNSENSQQKALLSACRMKISNENSTPALKFVGKMLEDNPKLFHIGIDMGMDESDVAAVSIGSLTLTAFGDLRQPGSMGSFTMEAATSLLNALCLRLSLFYDVRVEAMKGSSSLERIRLLLARSMLQVCAVLNPTSSGHTTSLGSATGTKSATAAINIRDQSYGVVCTLARSRFVLDSRYAFFDSGTSTVRTDNNGLTTSVSFPFSSISTATLLFGCASNEMEILRPRATSALDALLSAYVRVVKYLIEEEKKKVAEEKVIEDAAAASNAVSNPWAVSAVSAASSPKESTAKAIQQGERNRMILSQSLLPLIWSASRSNLPKSSRLAASRWSDELLLHLDPPNAYQLLCFLSGDEDATVSMIAKKALGVDSVMGEDIILTSDVGSSGGDADDSTKTTSFSVLSNAIVASPSNSESFGMKYDHFSVKAQAASLRFLVKSLLSEESFYGDEIDSSTLKEYVLTILKTLAYYKGRSLTRDETDLIDECSICLAGCTSSSVDARLVIIKSSRDDKLQYGFQDIAAQALTLNSSRARRHMAEVMRHLYEDESIWGNGSSQTTWIDTCGLTTTAQICRNKLSTMNESAFAVGEVHGAAFLGSSCVRSFRLAIARNKLEDTADENSNITKCLNLCREIISLLGKGLSHTDEVIGNACSKGLVIAFSYDGEDAPVLHQQFFDPVAAALDAMNAALKKYSSIDHADPTRVSSLVRASGLLLAASTAGAGFRKDASRDNAVDTIDLGPARLQCIDSLFAILGSAAYRKDDELSLAVGEAFVKYADAFGSGDWTSSKPKEQWPDSYDESFAYGLPPHQHIIFTLFKREIISSNPLKRNACAATSLAFVAHASRLVNLDLKFSQRSMVKEVWRHLSLFQSSFIKLLSDPKSKQLSRESCCIGLAACRGLASAMAEANLPHGEANDSSSDVLNDRLLKAFGQTSNHGRSAMMESDAQARERRNDSDGLGAFNDEAEVGGAAGLAEASLGAYTEMASAALSLGRPDILYSLMMLSANHTIWQTPELHDRYCAKSLLGKAEGSSLQEIRQALRPHLGKLIPRLLRACNDPTKQTREHMNILWLALTGGGADSRAAISQHLLPTIDTLMLDATSRLWKARSGAIGALSEILVGRSWQDLGGGAVEEDDEGINTHLTASIRLLRLWKLTMRALDDVRTPVRERGEVLGRTVRALTVRLCDPTAAEVTDDEDVFLSNTQRHQRKAESELTSGYAATVSLGWLVKYGLNQPCAEATGICISTLLGIVDVSLPSTLQPVLPELVGSLLMAMSGLEPAALNYLQVRASGADDSTNRYDNLERIRIQFAMSGPIAGALNKCLEMAKKVEVETQKKLIPELDTALRKGAGFATRAAVADAVTNLASTCPAAFKFPGNSTSNPAVRLLRALYYASERERGATAKDKMSHALGSLAELAPGKAVRVLALRACERYAASSGINNDPSTRKAAAATIRAISVRASNQFFDGGPKDIWRKKVLPNAFLGRHDEDAKVAGLWKDVWEEGNSSIGSSDDSFGVLLQEKILPFIVSAIISALRDISWARRRASCAAIFELSDANILAPPPRSSSEALNPSQLTDRFEQRAKASCLVLSECVKIFARNRIWAGKGDVAKAGTMIAGKWCAISPVNGKGSFENFEWFPLELRNDCQTDLFKGDGWFKLSEDRDVITKDDDCDTGATENEEDGDIDQSVEKDSALDFEGENEIGEEEPMESNDLDESDNVGNRGSQTVIFSGFCRVLLDQGLRAKSTDSVEGILPYKAAALGGLSALLKSVNPVKASQSYVETVDHQKFVYHLLAPRLFSFVYEKEPDKDKPAPLLIAKSIECLAAAMYEGIGLESLTSDQAEYLDPLKLMSFFQSSAGSAQPAWTVRETSTRASSILVSKMQSSILSKSNAITTVLDCSTQALKDRKFWKVRHAGLELILSLVNRVGEQKVSASDDERQLLLEAILPYKERILHIARQSLADTESTVTATASKITLTMSWWP